MKLVSIKMHGVTVKKKIYRCSLIYMTNSLTKCTKSLKGS